MLNCSKYFSMRCLFLTKHLVCLLWTLERLLSASQVISSEYCHKAKALSLLCCCYWLNLPCGYILYCSKQNEALLPLKHLVSLAPHKGGFPEAFGEQWVRSVCLLSRIKQGDSTVCRLPQAEVQQLMCLCWVNSAACLNKENKSCSWRGRGNSGTVKVHTGRSFQGLSRWTFFSTKWKISQKSTLLPSGKTWRPLLNFLFTNMLNLSLISELMMLFLL